MSDPRFEEMAALRSLSLLAPSGQTELSRAMEQDPELKHLAHEYDETAAYLALEAPQIAPPSNLKRDILRQLPEQRRTAKIIPYAMWIPYAIAACLMVLGIGQARQIMALKTKLAKEDENLAELGQRNTLLGVRLTQLEAKNAAYASAKVVVAWDPEKHRGVISMENLPPPEPGKDYQLWVLDPTTKAPISAGLIRPQVESLPFASQPVIDTRPGFAISLEPSGGSASPTGAILFAVAPGH